MKKKLLIIPIILCLIALSAVLSACSDIPADEQARNKGFTVEVTYNANGGVFSIQEKFVILVAPGSTIPPPNNGKTGSTTMLPSVSKSGYSLLGWFRGTINGEGGVDLGEEWDFNNDRVTENITLYAGWERDFVFRFSWKGEAGEEDGYYDVSTSTGFLKPSEQNLTNLRDLVKRSGYSLLGVYEDSGLTNLITDFSALENPLDPENPEYILYTEWIKGDYIFVKQASDMVYDPLKTGFYLENPNKVVDFKGEGWKDNSMGNFTGKIIGNGHTILNLKVTHKDVRDKDYLGLMNTLNGASVENLIFKNCVTEIIYSVGNPDTRPRNIGFFAGSITNGSVIKGVSFDNCALTVSAAAGLTNVKAPYYYYVTDGTSQTDGFTGEISYQSTGPA